MKKRIKLLALGLCLTLGAGALAACGDNNTPPPTKDPFASATNNWFMPEETYWVAGSLSGYSDSAWDEAAAGVPNAFKFEQNDDNKNIYRVTLNLYEGDSFKIRFEGLDWDDEPGKSKLSWDTHFDPAQREAEDSPFVDGGGMGGKNFAVATDGTYELRINTTGDDAVVTYVRKGDAPVMVTGVSLDKQSAVIAVGGEALTLNATIAPTDATDKSMTWTSSAPEVATVVDGVVTAVAEGSTKITVTASGKTASCMIFVVAEGTEIVEPEGVTLDKETLDLHVGDEETLVATKAPANATGEVVYTSSNTAVATVDIATGKVTALAAGTTTITATLLNKTTTCEVTVSMDYYLVGKVGGTENWGLQTSFDKIPEGRAFTKDAETGKYVIEDVTLNRGDSFKVIFLGMDSNWTGAVGFSEVSQEVGATAFADGGGNNIGVMDSAKYTLTLDVSGSLPVLTYEITEDIPDATYESIKVEVWGSAVENWANAYEGKTANATSENDYTVEITLELTANELFQFRSYNGDSNTVALYISRLDGTVDGLEIGNNIVCKTAGTYKFTLQFNEYGEIVSVTAVAVNEAE